MNHIDTCWYPQTKEFNKDCPKCMMIWNKFLDDKNLYVVPEKNEVD